MSPTMVIDPLSDRRSIMRSCIGERSCASSTTMWPYVRIVVVVTAGAGAGADRAARSASSSSGTSSDRPDDVVDVLGAGPVQQVDLGLGERASAREAQQRLRAEEVVEELAGVSTGHMRSSASRTSSVSRSRSRSSSGVDRSRLLDGERAQNGDSTKRRPALWVRARRRASATIAPTAPG